MIKRSDINKVIMVTIFFKTMNINDILIYLYIIDNLIGNLYNVLSIYTPTNFLMLTYNHHQV